jgi:hypothetical protein
MDNVEQRVGRPGNELVQNEVVRLDYGSFTNKTFFRCTLVFGGGLPPTIKDCDLIECAFALEGPAQNTVSLLAGIAKSQGGRELILQMFGLGSDV